MSDFDFGFFFLSGYLRCTVDLLGGLRLVSPLSIRRAEACAACSSVVECRTHAMHYCPEQLQRYSEAAFDGSARFILPLRARSRWVRFSLGMVEDLELKQQSRPVTLAPFGQARAVVRLL
jgi:hypothetical protein